MENISKKGIKAPLSGRNNIVDNGGSDHLGPFFCKIARGCQ